MLNYDLITLSIGLRVDSRRSRSDKATSTSISTAPASGAGEEVPILSFRPKKSRPLAHAKGLFSCRSGSDSGPRKRFLSSPSLSRISPWMQPCCSNSSLATIFVHAAPPSSPLRFLRSLFQYYPSLYAVMTLDSGTRLSPSAATSVTVFPAVAEWQLQKTLKKRAISGHATLWNIVNASGGL